MDAASTGAGGSSEVADLRARLGEAEETLRAIRAGEVDGLLISDDAGERVYTLRTADAPYRALVEKMNEGAATLTAQGHVIYCNQRFAQLLEMPLQQAIGASIDRLVEEADRVALRALIHDGFGKMRTPLRSRVGAAPVDAQVSVSIAAIDGVEHRTLIVTDISSLAQAERESRSKDEFLAMLAHELRNPLGAIGGAAQVLALAELNEPFARRARDVIERQVRQMARLVDDLLDIGRVMAGKIVLSLEPVDLADLVRSCIASMPESQRVPGRIEIRTEPVWVQADAVRLEQVVGNLASNALKFTPAESPIRIEVRRDGEEAVLSVTDRGAGIRPDLLPRVFDLFVQAEVAPDRAKGGLGIGLTLVRRLVERHGGTVSAASAGAGQGATFSVRLPAIAPAAAHAAATVVAPASPRCVLLVDDNAEAREMYSIALRREGHCVTEAEDAASALEVFRRARPDIAIVDIGLPGMDGYDLVRLLRREPGGGEVTLIALTGYGFPEDLERSREAGFDRHLVKPVSPEELRRELDAQRRTAMP